MKTFSVDEIVSLVRTKMDEIGMNESEMIGTETDNANLNKIIKSCIAEAYRLVSTLADISLIEGKDGSNATLTVNSDLVGEISLPSDFMRLVGIRLSSWSSSKSLAVPEDSPEYRMQSNKWVCGSPSYPVVALVNRPSGRKLELYKAASSEDTLSSFVYVASISNDATSVNISDQLAESFIYFVAALASTSVREEVADDFFKIARGLIGLE